MMSTTINTATRLNGGEMYLPDGSVYFIGIGGIGMSALARYFKGRGAKVSGYDKTRTELTMMLEREGIDVHYSDDERLLDKDATLVVYTPAVPDDHKEFNYYKANKYNIKKRSEVLGMITSSSYNICVAGTHGKTTTSAMIAHVLRHSGFGCYAFLGGITTNYGTNFWSSSNNVCVAEADEYDRSFLALNPDIAVITSMDPDHLDIYGTEESMQEAFLQFSRKVKKEGLMIFKKGIARSSELSAGKLIGYSLSDNSADAYAENVVVENGGYRYDITVKDKRISDIFIGMGGRHNIENSVAAVTAAVELGIPGEKIRAAVADFKGVKRRFEFIVKSKQCVFIDDYAHHPQELKALLEGVRDLYPGKKLTIVFQPHLYSRTRDLAEGFASVLDMADEILLLPVYPARELPIDGIGSNTIAERMHSKVRMVDMKDLASAIEMIQPELLVTAGAGDIDMMLQEIKNVLSK